MDKTETLGVIGKEVSLPIKSSVFLLDSFRIASADLNCHPLSQAPHQQMIVTVSIIEPCSHLGEITKQALLTVLTAAGKAASQQGAAVRTSQLQALASHDY